MKAAARSAALLGLGIILLGCGDGRSSNGTGGTAGGAAGASGTTGSAGTTGTAGTTGSAGITGTAGTTGSAGATGTAGTTGAAGATGAAGSGGVAGTGAGARGGVGGSTGTAGRGGTGGTGGGAGRGGAGGAGRGGTGGGGNAGRGGTGGGGGGESCGGEICGPNEFCCGPPACGNCRNILTGPNCPTTCDGRGGAGGASGAGGAGRGGQGGGDCTVTPCPTGQVCFSRTAGAAIISVECIADPCAPAALACSCAQSTLETCNQLCMVTGQNITCGSRCAAPDTPIATPSGEQPIATLRPGDLVYSMHRGRLMAVPIVQAIRTPVARHHVVRVALETGRVLHISSGHPTADGATFADLRAGARLGARRVVAAELVPYPHAFTYDVLPDSDSGTYVAAGALVGSTLATHR